MLRPSGSPRDQLFRSDSVPSALKERLIKAEGHINAAERKLWAETHRGFWSGRQAVARLAEAWLHLHEALPELPAVERYLPDDLTQSRIDAFLHRIGPGPLSSAWQEISAAEAEIHGHPFAEAQGLYGESIRPHVGRFDRYVRALRHLRDAIADEIAARYVRLRPISNLLLRSTILDALRSESMFDELHYGAAVPEAAVAAARVTTEICTSLQAVIDREYLDLSIRRDVSYGELREKGDPERLAGSDSSQLVASVVTYDSAGRSPLHVIEVIGQWDRQACLDALHRLSCLIGAGGVIEGKRATPQWLGLACYHTHRGVPGEPPWFDFNGGLTLSDEIEAAVECAFRSGVPNVKESTIPSVETFAFDRWGKPPAGNGTVTGALIEFGQACSQ
jgi:hypothetical protein